MTVSTDRGCLGAHATAALHSIGWPAVVAVVVSAAEAIAAAALVIVVVVEEKSARGCVRWAPIRVVGEEAEEEEEEEEACARAEVLGVQVLRESRLALLLTIAWVLVLVVVDAALNMWSGEVCVSECLCVCVRARGEAEREREKREKSVAFARAPPSRAAAAIALRRAPP
jgi:hypothetical protein